MSAPIIVTKGDEVSWTEEARRILVIQTLHLGPGPFLVLDATISTLSGQIEILIDVDRPQRVRYDWYSTEWFKLAA